jgi:hypothetical protein
MPICTWPSLTKVLPLSREWRSPYPPLSPLASGARRLQRLAGQSVKRQTSHALAARGCTQDAGISRPILGNVATLTGAPGNACSDSEGA